MEDRYRDLVEKVASRAEIRAEELEQRFRERMEMSLNFELAKIEHARRRAASPLPAQVALGLDPGPPISAEHSPIGEEAYRHLNHLRQRYEQLQGMLPNSDELRRRLSGFYACVCPSKLGNVARIVDSFTSRGATQQALRDLNRELLDTYGCDLDSFQGQAESNLSLSRTSAKRSPPLQERLAMLSDEARLLPMQQPEQHADGHLSSRQKVYSSISSQRPVGYPSSPILTPAAHFQPHPPLTFLYHSLTPSGTFPPPQMQHSPPAQQQQQLPRSPPQLLHSSQQAPQAQTPPPPQQQNHATFVGPPSPRWAGVREGEEKNEGVKERK